ncbi:MAG: sugar phosphate isomerase/epimerase [Thermoproteota archaeon]|nr:sugar phosphate isomerase/epimerase [Candidatus Brockarchaeota archaeon]
MGSLRVGAQLIIWGVKPIENLESVLSEVREAGYEGIETSLEIVSKDIMETKRLLFENGLRLVALHMGIGDIGQVEQAVKSLEKLNGEYLTFSGPGGKGSEEDYLKCAGFLNTVGKICREHGIKTCYHNHGHEIANNQRGIRIIIQNTEPELVGLCVDTYWVKFGGADPLQFIKTNKERIVYLHLKDGSDEDMKNRRFSELGKGSIDFPAILSFTTQQGVKWVVVEQDWTPGSPFESMLENRSYLRKIGY